MLSVHRVVPGLQIRRSAENMGRSDFLYRRRSLPNDEIEILAPAIKPLLSDLESIQGHAIFLKIQVARGIEHDPAC